MFVLILLVIVMIVFAGVNELRNMPHSHRPQVMFRDDENAGEEV